MSTHEQYGSSGGPGGPGGSSGPGGPSGPGRPGGPGGPSDSGGEDTVHDAAGAYVLGILDEAEATAFEEHLAECDICAVHLEEFSGMEPMLAMLADGADLFAPPASSTPSAPPVVPAPRRLSAAPPPEGLSPAPPPAVSVQPSPELLDRLVDEVAAKRAKRKRRGIYLVAAAAALIIGGPTVAVVATSDDSPASNQAISVPTDDAYLDHMKQKFSATDAVTKVSATVGVESKGWGTNAVLELSNVKGPLKCELVAVSKTGDEQVLSSWAVPAWGYGITDSPHDVARKPLYVHGGAALAPSDIDHFEVRTFDGKPLVKVDA
jgi:hypothetical protein